MQRFAPGELGFERIVHHHQIADGRPAGVSGLFTVFAAHRLEDVRRVDILLAEFLDLAVAQVRGALQCSHRQRRSLWDMTRLKPPDNSSGETPRSRSRIRAVALLSQ